MLPIAFLSCVIASTPGLNDSPIVEHPSAWLSDSIAAQTSTASPTSRGDLYLRLSGGLVTTRDANGQGTEDVKFNEGYLLGVAIGKRASSGAGPVNVDVELEGIWSQQDASNSGALQAVDDINVGALMINAMLEFEIAHPLSLYAGAGVGGAWMKVGTNSDGTNDFKAKDGPFFAWQARAGLQWQFTPGIAANVGYRFLNVADTRIDDNNGTNSFDLSTEQHVLELGIRFGI
jgi:opacity protein-like surface antigen